MKNPSAIVAESHVAIVAPYTSIHDPTVAAVAAAPDVDRRRRQHFAAGERSIEQALIAATAVAAERDELCAHSQRKRVIP